MSEELTEQRVITSVNLRTYSKKKCTFTGRPCIVFGFEVHEDGVELLNQSTWRSNSTNVMTSPNVITSIGGGNAKPEDHLLYHMSYFCDGRSEVNFNPEFSDRFILGALTDNIPGVMHSLNSCFHKYMAGVLNESELLIEVINDMDVDGIELIGDEEL